MLWGNKESELLETKGDEFYELGRKDIIIISTNVFPGGGWRRDIYLEMRSGNAMIIFLIRQRKT